MGIETTQLDITGISRDTCSATVGDCVAAIEGVRSVDVNESTDTVRVQYDSRQTSPTDIRETVAASGDESVRWNAHWTGISRRKLLGLAAGGATVSVAGCANLYAFGSEPEPRKRPRIGNETDDQAGEDGDGSDGDDEETNGDDDQTDGVERYRVHYLKQGETIEVPADKSLLVAGEEQGWDLPFQCRRGICGVCTARLWGNARERVSMQDPDDPSRRNQFLEDDEIRDGFTLTCVGYPQSDFVLETGERDALDR